MGAFGQSAQSALSAEAEELRDIVYSIESLTSQTAIVTGQHAVQFTLDGLRLEVCRTQNGDESLVSIKAFVGYLPFSIQSQEKRKAALHIMADTAKKLFAKFEMDNCGRIFAKGLYIKDVDRAPDFIFYPLMMFLQEARPFITLLGEHVSA